MLNRRRQPIFLRVSCAYRSERAAPSGFLKWNRPYLGLPSGQRRRTRNGFPVLIGFYCYYSAGPARFRAVIGAINIVKIIAIFLTDKIVHSNVLRNDYCIRTRFRPVQLKLKGPHSESNFLVLPSAGHFPHRSTHRIASLCRRLLVYIKSKQRNFLFFVIVGLILILTN